MHHNDQYSSLNKSYVKTKRQKFLGYKGISKEHSSLADIKHIWKKQSHRLKSNNSRNIWTFVSVTDSNGWCLEAKTTMKYPTLTTMWSTSCSHSEKPLSQKRYPSPSVTFFPSSAESFTFPISYLDAINTNILSKIGYYKMSPCQNLLQYRQTSCAIPAVSSVQNSIVHSNHYLQLNSKWTRLT